MRRNLPESSLLLILIRVNAVGLHPETRDGGGDGRGKGGKKGREERQGGIRKRKSKYSLYTTVTCFILSSVIIELPSLAFFPVKNWFIVRTLLYGFS